MPVNYLPFIKRQHIELPVEAAASAISTYFTSIPQFTVSGGGKVFFTDCYVYPEYLSTVDNTVDTVQMRMGITGRSYLTSQFYPLIDFYDGTVKETGCWRFAKPYRVFPGDRLKVKETHFYEGVRYQIHPAVIFSGVRVLDNKPVLLYQALDEFAEAANSVYLLSDDSLRCPDDSPVDILAMVTNIPGAPYNLNFEGIPIGTGSEMEKGLMVWGPDGRPWWDDETWRYLLYTDSHVIDLQKPEWVLDAGETLVFEFKRSGAFQNIGSLWITVRGSYEVHT